MTHTKGCPSGNDFFIQKPDLLGSIMSAYDLILVHTPSVYDFRKQQLLYGPVSDVVPSTPVFEMYPIGFTSIAS